MQHVRAFAGGAPLIGDFKIGATVVPGQVGRWVADGAGTVTNPSGATDMGNALGIILGAAGGGSLTYSTSQAGPEGVATVVYDPMAIIRSRVVPSATAGTEYANGDGYFLTNTSASAGGVTVTDASVGGSSADAVDGFLFALSGNNARLHRVITTHTSSSLVTVTVPFPRAIAVGDTFVFSQYGQGVINAQMTSDFVELDGTIAGATGGACTIVDVYVDQDFLGTQSAPRLYAEFVFRDHAFNAL